METNELEAEVRTALKGNSELIKVLPNGASSIYHYVAPSVDPVRYPIIVYSPISDVPALTGDNREIAHRVTIRIHVITLRKRFEVNENKFLTACRLIGEIMTNLGFVRRQTTSLTDGSKLMKVIDFVKGV